MKVRLSLIGLIILTVLFSCSKNSDDKNGGDQSDNVTLTINNVYVEDPSVPAGTECNPDFEGSGGNITLACWRDIIITDGAYTQSPTDGKFYPDNNTTYKIAFLEVQLVGDISTPNVFENIWDSANGVYQNRGFDAIQIYVDVIMQNGNYVSSTDLTETEGTAMIEILGPNSLRFEIEMLDGTIYNGSFNGNITILNDEYTFVPYEVGG